MELKENPTAEDLFTKMNEIKAEIETGEVYSQGRYVGTIKIRGKEFRVGVMIESPNGLEFFY